VSIVLLVGVVAGLLFVKKKGSNRAALVDDTASMAPADTEINNSAKPIVGVPAEMKVNLPVPYLSQMPDGLFVLPWSKACEEASITMIAEFYAKNNEKFLPITRGKESMNKLMAWEDKEFGYNDDTDASSTARIINEASSFTAVVKLNPTLEEIKDEIRNNRPVVSFHYGPGLKNPYLHFKADGANYHVIILKGFDDEKQEFIAHDAGTYQYSGDDYRYSYDTIMNSLRDYDLRTKKAKDGVPTVLFTQLTTPLN
jgi:uncharacterized protein YvpB